MNLLPTKSVILLFWVLILCGCDNESYDTQTQQNDELSDSNELKIIDTIKPKIKQLESILQLPKEAWPLLQYDRYYIIDDDNFDAVYFFDSKDKGLVYFVSSKDEMPFILDGGCSLINISGQFSDPDNIELFCNGSA